MPHHPLLNDIDAFLRIHKLSDSAFGRQAVNDWKLIRQTGKKGKDPVEQLFDLAKDVGETKNVAADNADKLKEMSARLDAILKTRTRAAK